MTFVPYIAKSRTFNDFRFDFHIVNETGKSWYDGSPEQMMPERGWCASKIKQGMTVVDCGAHHGMMSVIFAHAAGPSGRVISYEALPSNARVVERNAALNGMYNVTVRPVGVGDVPGRFAVNLNSSNTVVVGGGVVTANEGSDMIEIVRLDDDLPQGVHVDFLKVDVEGYDLQALRGMDRTLQQRPIMDLELHNFLFDDSAATLQQIIAILTPLRYSWELLGEIVETPIQIGPRLQVEQLLQFQNPHLLGVPIG